MQTEAIQTFGEVAAAGDPSATCMGNGNNPTNKDEEAGAAYISSVHAIACKVMGIRHLRTRPRRPQTNGKAERFIRTMLGGWAYGAIYRDSQERTAALSGWLDFYNWRRPHGSLSHRPPGVRLAELNNVAGTYI